MLWHSREIEKVLAELETSQSGLSAKQALQRQELFGLNKLPKGKSISSWLLLFKQFTNPLVYILLGVLIISLFIGHSIDAIFILFIILANGLVSFWQEKKTNRVLEKLMGSISFRAKVLRQGDILEIYRENLTPGDVIILEAGDQVPADARLFEVNNLKVSEASLTGEFWGVKKIVEPLPAKTSLGDRQNMVWLGTSVESGRGKAVVVTIGHNTQLAAIARLAGESKLMATPLQKKMRKFARWFAGLIIAIASLIFTAGVFQGMAMADIFTVSAALAVSAIPEGLLPVMTVVLVLGMRRIAKQNGLVRRLSSAETLGGATVLCVDKTGTLTTARMAISQTAAEDPMLALDIALHCNAAYFDEQGRIIGSPTDQALLQAALKSGLKRYRPELKRLPFSQENKFIATLHPGRLYVAGAPEKILALSKEKKYEAEIKKFAKQGQRVIGLAWKKSDQMEVKDLDFTGLMVLEDPLRPGIKKSIKSAQRAGIRVIIVSGDHPLTVKNIANKINLDTRVGHITDGEKLKDLSNSEINNIDVFARVSPQDKLRIVEALQEKGEVVAMTGDGVNDAPALSRADVGIALASGTDVAKEVADLVLLKNSFNTILGAIKEGRIIFANLKKVMLYLLSNSFSEVILVFLSILFSLPLPLLPVQILWINIVEDTFPDFALATEAAESGIMKKKRRPSQLLDPALKKLILIIAILTGLTSFSLFLILLKFNLEISLIRTMIFASQALSSLLFVFSCRSLSKNILYQPLKNKWLLLAVGVSLLFLSIAIYLPLFNTILQTVPLVYWHWGAVLLAAVIDIVLIEIFKYKLIIKNA